MKDISAAFIIDEAIKKLEKLQEGNASTEELYAVRAYCDLLLKTVADNASKTPSFSAPSKATHPSTQNRLLEDGGANGSSLLDF